ncbi:cytochrome c oxidase assembly protein [Cellulomonas sp. zg-ZUI199]|uniref:Cytochrome c oxidase assembly protein n=1 Tax=Cellulomonas wangleii TaxID=2816956 RepID=A0ABX8D807_9CELL|nr:cytochrome c oxidase assembly protein [Cellulomonas wangleii]MBO0923890.1 cytochrome c oxidase assembly protein [Cellulomonas wangleii]MBO0924172.1 cytochrome c oxidase assembly protein [Cellulomonas wangleii]QVI62192.1 cytochrome c oxidase assembly protein [Cellulomonas wangleii]
MTPGALGASPPGTAVLAHAGHGTAAAAWGPDAVAAALLAAALVAGYVLAARRHGRRVLRPWPVHRTVAWVTGCALVAVALSPVLAVVPGDASRHMVQHLLLGMLAPLALVLAAPLTLLLRVTTPGVRRVVGGVLAARPVHVLSHPVTAAVLHVGGVAALYLTPLYALTTRSAAAHVAVHVHFLAAGYLFAWALAGPDPAPRRPGTATRLVVLVLAGGAHAALAKLLYAHADRLPPGAVHAPGDVEAAAQWMYYGGDVAEVLLAVAVLAAWYRAGARRGSGTGQRVTGERVTGERVTARSAPATATARSPGAPATG